MPSYHLTLLKNETEIDHLEWVEAIENSNRQIEYNVVELSADDWLEQIQSQPTDMLIARPPGGQSHFKQLYDERVFVLNKVLGIPMYPTLEEVQVYENKRVLTYWLKANKVAHPETHVFYHKAEALAFVDSCSYPIVAKTAIGSSSRGVSILDSREDAVGYLDRAFSEEGIAKSWVPNVRSGDLAKRILRRLVDLPGTLKYLREKKQAAVGDVQRWYVIFQEFIPHTYEWRSVRIGDSYFSHKKVAGDGDRKMSGTSLVSWDGPSVEQLDFVKAVTDKRGFYSQAVDMFEPEPGKFLVNELQCYFGSKNPHQMILDGKPGRYFQKDGQWQFEEGEFGQFNSHALRLEHVLSLINQSR